MQLSSNSLILFNYKLNYLLVIAKIVYNSFKLSLISLKKNWLKSYNFLSYLLNSK